MTVTLAPLILIFLWVLQALLTLLLLGDPGRWLGSLLGEGWMGRRGKELRHVVLWQHVLDSVGGRFDAVLVVEFERRTRRRRRLRRANSFTYTRLVARGYGFRPSEWLWFAPHGGRAFHFKMLVPVLERHHLDAIRIRRYRAVTSVPDSRVAMSKAIGSPQLINFAQRDTVIEEMRGLRPWSSASYRVRASAQA